MSEPNNISEDKADEQKTKLKKPKVVFVEIDDEVTQVFDNFKKIKEKEIILIIPKEAVLFQSIINLKILKQKTEEIKKTIYLITKDKIGLYLGRQAGFVVSDDIDSSLEWKGDENFDNKLNIKPISASSNVAQNIFKKLPKSKQHIFDILKNFRQASNDHNFFQKIFSHFIKRPRILSEHKVRFSIPNRRALSTLIIMSIAILIVSAYIILPGATIYITPKADVTTQPLNIVLADNEKYTAEIQNKDQHIIPMYFYETDISEKMTYRATGKLFEGKNAVGKVKLINLSNNPWSLIPNTRLQTSEGLVFRVQDYVTIPPKKTDAPGEIQVNVVADESDIFAEIIGVRGNIKPTNFFLPGLSQSSQKLLYAESYEPFTGGETAFKELVTEEDLFAAEELIKNQVLDNLKTKLKEEILTINKKHNTNFYLVLEDNLIEKDKISVILPENILNNFIPQFDVQAQMHVKVPYYNFDELIEILKAELVKHMNPKKRLVKTYEQNLQFEIVEIDKKQEKIKITAILSGLEEFNLDADTETGKRIRDKIIKDIAGKTIEEANNYIQSLPEVNKVKIETWPAWAINIPNVQENIEIKVVSLEE